MPKLIEVLESADKEWRCWICHTVREDDDATYCECGGVYVKVIVCLMVTER